MGSIETYI